MYFAILHIAFSSAVGIIVKRPPCSGDAVRWSGADGDSHGECRLEFRRRKETLGRAGESSLRNIS